MALPLKSKKLSKVTQEVTKGMVEEEAFFSNLTSEWTEFKKDPFLPLRKESLKQFMNLGRSKLDEENWENTPLSKLKERSYFYLSSLSSKAKERLEVKEREKDLKKCLKQGFKTSSSMTPSSPRIVFYNGTYSPEFSNLSCFEKIKVYPVSSFFLGKELSSLKKEGQSFKEIQSLLLPKIKSLLRNQRERFTLLNHALFSEGYVIDVSRDVSLKDPIQVIYVSRNSYSKKNDLMTHLKNFIFIGSSSKISLIESFLSFSNTSYSTNTVTHINLAKGASLSYIRLQKESPEAFHIGSSYANLDEEALLETFYLSSGSSVSRYNSEFNLNGKGASTKSYEMSFGKENQYANHNAVFRHQSPETLSYQLSKGILVDHSEVSFYGKVRMEKNAKKSSSDQLNKNLLLGKKARVFTRPQLEIHVDDVKATHGATVSQLNQEEIFYLMNRGLSKEKALSLLVRGFIQDIYLKLEPPLRERLRSFLNEEIKFFIKNPISM